MPPVELAKEIAKLPLRERIAKWIGRIIAGIVGAGGVLKAWDTIKDHIDPAARKWVQRILNLGD